MITLLVVVGAALGAPARYVGDVLITARTDESFPYGTLTVNVVGSFLLGLVTGLALHHGLSSSWQALVGTGFCGTLTTYSTFSVEAAGLLRDGRPVAAAANVLGSAAAGLLAAAAGLGLALV
ncbi:MAG: fluoride efflux transporter CrcB [Mycobacteriales bacterium]